MPTPRCHLALAAAGGLIYAIGGTNTSGSIKYSTVEVYNPSTNNWTTAASMPTGRQDLIAVAINGLIYAVGGWNPAFPNSGFLATNEVYNPATNVWATGAQMPTARALLAGGTANGRLYAVGGSDATSILATNEAYNPGNDTWTTDTSMPTARTSLGAGVINNVLYAVGGGNSSSALATNEAFAPLVYEGWTEGFIRSDRWLGGQNSGGQEVSRLITPGQMLLLRYRREGSTASDTGNAQSALFLNTINPTQIDEIEATFTVTSLSMTTCAANNSGAATRAHPARLLMEKFNDGTQSDPGDRTGDYLAGVQAIRDGSSADPAGVMNVVGFVNRCTNAACTTNTPVISNALATTVSVGQSFTLRLKWDQPNHQFLFGLDSSADTALPYAASDTAPANNTFVDIHVQHRTANCTAGAVVIDSTTLVGTVQTNSSAVIP